MNKFNKEKDKGFVELVVIVIVALALLKYFFDFSVFEALSSEQGRATVGYVKDILNYLKEMIVNLFNYIR
jgi:hypothetical protein